MIKNTPSVQYTQPTYKGDLVSGRLFRDMRAIYKRLFDVLAASIGLILLSPLFVYAMIMIKRDSPGPIFYKGPRMGRREKYFNIIKFRTMYERKESFLGPRVTSKDDDRITPFGHWLRDSKVNELPQLINVLFGDMSLVGPRPEDFEIAKTWPLEMRKEILSVRPGITSPASILYQDEEKMLSTSTVMEDYYKKILPDKMRLDRLYVRNHSFSTDLDVLFWTASVWMPQALKSRIPEAYLFAGPITRITNRYLSWFLIDLFVTFGACLTAILLWSTQGALDWGAPSLIFLSLFVALLFSSINSILGLNRIAWSEAFVEDAAGLLFSAGITTLLMIGLNIGQTYLKILADLPLLPIPVVFTIGLMASVGFLVARYRWRLLTGFASRWINWRNRKGIVERVLIVGSGEGIQLANWLLKQGDGRYIFSIVGIIDDEQPVNQGMEIKGNRILGGMADIPRIIEKFDVGVVIFAIPKATDDVERRVISCCGEDVRMVYLTDLLTALQNQITRPNSSSKQAE